MTSTRYVRAVILSVAMVIAGSGVAVSQAGSLKLINLGSHRLEAYIEGEGDPTVVIDAGLGEGIANWRAVQESIATVTRVVTYNRAGYGGSDPGPLPRACGREVEELKALLDSASIAGPYVLVGHSLGALNAAVFASKYPDRIAGMVLLDPPPLSFIRREVYPGLLATADEMTGKWQAQADSGATSSDPRTRAEATFLRMIASEHREMFGGESEKEISEISTFGDIPLIVIASGKPNPAFGDVAEEFQEYWVDQSRAICRKSSSGMFVLAEKSSHQLHVDAPDLVDDIILSVVHQIRGER